MKKGFTATIASTVPARLLPFLAAFRASLSGSGQSQVFGNEHFKFAVAAAETCC
jgi:hypothetical protein